MTASKTGSAAGNGKYESLLLSICEVLQHSDTEMTVKELAAATHTSVAEIRKTIRNVQAVETDASTEVLVDVDLPYIEPANFDPESDEEPESDDDLVYMPADFERLLGTEFFDAEVLGPLYAAAEARAIQEPDNAVLADACQKLREIFLVGVRRPTSYRGQFVAPLNKAIGERRKVRIRYSRLWQPGRIDRVIEPLRMVETIRGVEIDAGPIADDGGLRSYIVARIEDLEVLEETFVPDPEAESLLLTTRATRPVEGTVRADKAWVVEKWAERVEFQPETPSGKPFVAHLLPPLEERVALILITAGDGCRFRNPALNAEGASRATALLEHHGLA